VIRIRISSFRAPQAGRGLAFTRDSFVYSGIVHRSIRFFEFDTSSLATTSRLYFAINIAQCMGFPLPPCVAIQHTRWVMSIFCKGQVGADVRIALSGSFYRNRGSWVISALSLIRVDSESYSLLSRVPRGAGAAVARNGPTAGARLALYIYTHIYIYIYICVCLWVCVCVCVHICIAGWIDIDGWIDR